MDALSLDSILKKHNASGPKEDAFMLDVDQYLNQLNEMENDTMLSDHSVREHDVEMTDRTHENYQNSETESNFDRSMNENQYNNQKRLDTAGSSKQASMYGRNKKSMKEFMKSQLSKTKQTGDHAVYMVCKGFLRFITC